MGQPPVNHAISHASLVQAALKIVARVAEREWIDKTIARQPPKIVLAFQDTILSVLDAWIVITHVKIV